MPVFQVKNISKDINIGIWKITETEDELLKILIDKGFDKSTSYQTKNKQRLKQWLATRILLSEFFENTNITYDELGKPHLNNGWFISISHSNEFVAINLNKNNHCGIDIEKITPKIERIKHKFLNPIDLQNVTSLEKLTLYWGAKEALYKYYGRKEVLFIENLFISNFSENSSSFKGKIEMPDFKIKLSMTWEKIEDYLLVYTL
jgi:4'-phosphopantetheinyl transferase